ncbi:MAG: MATE family efflux transporter [Clostridia bacterium]|nr:MATE family efflux transporter [Clostridia bacterium]
MAKDMTRGSLSRALIAFSIPLVLSGLLQQLYSWADAFIVGNAYGETALAAIGATTSLFNLFNILITGFSSGVSILCAQVYGEGERSALKRVLFSFTLILGGLSLLLTLLCAPAAHVLLSFLQTPQDIIAQSASYLRIVLAGLPFIAVYNVHAAVLRGMGDSKAPMLSVLISSLLNIVLDILLVYGLHLGVRGAAAATLIAQVLMALFIVAYARRYDALRMRLSLSQYDAPLVSRGCRLAVPITVQSGVNSVGHLALQNFMNGFGTQTVAAITSAYRIDSIILLPIINLGTAISTVVAQNTGAGKHERARKGLAVGFLLMTAVSLILTAVVMTLGGGLIAIFGVTPQAAEIGAAFFRHLGAFYVIFGLCTAMRGYMEGMGHVVFSGAIGIASLAVRIALSYALCGVHGNMVIALAEGYSWCFMLAIYLIRLKILSGGKRQSHRQ